MNRIQSIIVSVTSIFLVLLLLVGLTYAYFLTQINGNENSKSISVTTANLKLTYSDGNGIIEPEGLIIPGTTIDNKTFTVKNDGSVKTDYVVVIEDVKVTYATTVGENTAGTKTTFESNDFVYTLTCESDGEICDSVTSESIFPISEGILIGNKIETGETHTYTLTVTYKDTGIDQSNDMNKTLEAKVNIADITSINPYSDNTNSLAYNIINNAIGLTAEEKENGYAELVAAPPTKVASEISSFVYKTSNPETYDLSTTPTTSYYFIYADSYKFDRINGTYSLVNPKIGQYSNIYQNLAGKYISLPSGYNTQNYANQNAVEGKTFSSIYKVTESASEVTETGFKYNSLIKEETGGESVLSITHDDYGISYYYRGSVKNNYVTFNNMCWRIVRIEGDGAVKLILADKDGVCSEETQEKTDSSYIGKGTYGYDKNNNAIYEGSISGGSMKYKMNEWFNTNLSNVSNKLKTTSICIGETTNKYNSDGILLSPEEISVANSWYYENYKRLGMDRVATLRCLPQAERTSDAQIYPLTADEAAFAGAKVGEVNKTYYLKENANVSYWWNLSPGGFKGYGQAFNINNYGKLSITNARNIEGNLRPTIILSSNIEIDNGNGIIANPYIIK